MAITYRHSNKVRQVSSSSFFEILIKKTSKFLDVSLKSSHPPSFFKQVCGYRFSKSVGLFSVSC